MPVQYAAIIDAGSSSSRMLIYQWTAPIPAGVPLVVRKVFPPPGVAKEVSEAVPGKLFYILK